MTLASVSWSAVNGGSAATITVTPSPSVALPLLLSGLAINQPIHPIAGALRLRMHQLLSSPIQIGQCKQGK